MRNEYPVAYMIEKRIYQWEKKITPKHCPPIIPVFHHDSRPTWLNYETDAKFLCLIPF